MEFFGHTLLWAWCREHGFVLVEGDGPVAPRLAEDTTLTSRERVVHSAAGDAPVARALADRLAAALGTWDECLAWATDWDVWENEEDWPRYYAWRARYGERRSLGAASGHLFGVEDAEALSEFLAHAIGCGWDVTLLPARVSRPTGVRARTSHDGWIEVHAGAPVGFASPAV
jgi:hypothetical protein